LRRIAELDSSGRVLLVSGHHMVLPGGHASIADHHPAGAMLARLARHFMGEFPRITMELACRLCADIYGERASLGILVNDWYALKHEMFGLLPAERAHARRQYWQRQAAGELVFADSGDLLAELPARLSGLRGRAMFSELALKNRFDAIINRQVSIVPYGFPDDYGHQHFARDYASLAMDEGARRVFEVEGQLALTCQRASDGGCAEEVFMLLGELGRVNAPVIDHLVLFLPLVCRNPVGIGARVAHAMFPALRRTRITAILMNQVAVNEQDCFDGCVVEEIGGEAGAEAPDARSARQLG
jgi:hypothetical protein